MFIVIWALFHMVPFSLFSKKRVKYLFSSLCLHDSDRHGVIVASHVQKCGFCRFI